jgi:capsular polysaccharide biosynthesis protein
MLYRTSRRGLEVRAGLGVALDLARSRLAGVVRLIRTPSVRESRKVMTLSNTVRVLLIRWYITVPGLLLSLIIAGATFSLVPPQYTSSGVAVLVPPKKPEAGLSSANPLLNFNPSLNMTALVMIQGLNSPAVSTELGLTPGEDSFTVKNVNDASVDGKAGQPLIYVTAQSSIPEKSAAIVVSVVDMARQDLVDSQNDLRVSQRSGIRLVSVVAATPPKLVPGTRLVVSGVALMLGLIVTIIAACALSRFVLARRLGGRDALASRAVDDVDRKVIDCTPIVAATMLTPNGGVMASNYSSAMEAYAEVLSLKIEEVVCVGPQPERSDMVKFSVSFMVPSSGLSTKPGFHGVPPQAAD